MKKLRWFFFLSCVPNSVSLKIMFLQRLSDSPFLFSENTQGAILPVNIQPAPWWSLAVRNTERIIPPCLLLERDALHNYLEYIYTYFEYTPTLSVYLSWAQGLWKIVSSILPYAPFLFMIFNDLGDIFQICQEMVHAELLVLFVKFKRHIIS